MFCFANTPPGMLEGELAGRGMGARPRRIHLPDGRIPEVASRGNISRGELADEIRQICYNFTRTYILYPGSLPGEAASAAIDALAEVEPIL